MLAQERTTHIQAAAAQPAARAGSLPGQASAAQADEARTRFQIHGAQVRRETSTWLPLTLPGVPTVGTPTRPGPRIATGAEGHSAIVGRGRTTPLRGSVSDRRPFSSPRTGEDDSGALPFQSRGCVEPHPSRRTRSQAYGDRRRPTTRLGPLSRSCSTALTRPEGVLEA